MAPTTTYVINPYMLYVFVERSYSGIGFTQDISTPRSNSRLVIVTLATPPGNRSDTLHSGGPSITLYTARYSGSSASTLTEYGTTNGTRRGKQGCAVRCGTVAVRHGMHSGK